MIAITTHIPEKFTGIIRITPDDDSVLRMLQDHIASLDSTQLPIENLHITLLHQSFPKKVGSGKTRGDKLLKTFYKAGGTHELQSPALTLRNVKFAVFGDRTSTYIEVKERAACLKIRDQILEGSGITPENLKIDGPEETRVFHISLTNLTGKANDSIAFPNENDTMWGEL